MVLLIFGAFPRLLARRIAPRRRRRGRRPSGTKGLEGPAALGVERQSHPCEKDRNTRQQERRLGDNRKGGVRPTHQTKTEQQSTHDEHEEDPISELAVGNLRARVGG